MTTATRVKATARNTKSVAPSKLAAEHNGIATGKALQGFGVNAYDNVAAGITAATSFAQGFWKGLTK